jgi:hypothetical protein
MEQRPLRLGDIADDYCPRERRLTNHVVVAMVGDAIRQTRCMTCDAEHLYKGARMPRLRKKDGSDDPNTAGPPETSADAGGDASAATPQAGASSVNGATPAGDAGTAGAPPESQDEPADDRPDVAWPAHRQLIRATLPRVEGEQPVPRPIPEFTMHQRATRGGHAFRQSQGWQGNNGFGRGGFRPGPPGPGRDQGQGDGRPGPGGGGGKRRRHRGKHKPPR